MPVLRVVDRLAREAFLFGLALLALGVMVIHWATRPLRR